MAATLTCTRFDVAASDPIIGVQPSYAFTVFGEAPDPVLGWPLITIMRDQAVNHSSDVTGAATALLAASSFSGGDQTSILTQLSTALTQIAAGI